MERLTRNLRCGVRSLRRTPGFTLTAALTLALGIGLVVALVATLVPAASSARIDPVVALRHD